MADINAEGLNQVNESVEGLNDSIQNSTSSLNDALKEGLHELKEEILKVAVQSLPKDFLDLAKKVEDLTTFTKKMSELSEKQDKNSDEALSKEKTKDKAGPSTGWTPEKLASKTSEKEAAPALTIIQSMNSLFGGEGLFLKNLTDILQNQSTKSELSMNSLFGEKGIFLRSLTDILQNQLVKSEENKKKDDKGEKGGGENLKGPDDKMIGQYSKGIKKLDSLFGGILKVFFRQGKPRFTPDQIKSINEMSVVFNNLSIMFSSISKTVGNVIVGGVLAPMAASLMPHIDEFIDATQHFVRYFKDNADVLNKENTKEIRDVTENLEGIFGPLMKAEMSAILAGILAPIASVLLPLITLFILSTKLLLVTFKLISVEEALFASSKASSLNTLYSNIMWAEIYAIPAGLLAIPAAILLLPIALFVLLSSLVVTAFNSIDLKKISEAALKASALKNVFIWLPVIAGSAIIAGVLSILAIPATILIAIFLIFASIVIELFDTLFGIGGLVKTILMAGLLVVTFGLLFVAEKFAIKAGGEAIPALLGLVMIAIFIAAVAIIGALSTFILPFLVFITVAAILIAVTMIVMGIAIKAVINIQKILEENKPKGDAKKTGTMLDALLSLVGMLIPMAFLMVGFFFLGLLAILCLIPMLGLFLFSMIAMNALPMFGMAIGLLFGVLNQVGDLFVDAGGGGPGGFLEKACNVFPPLKIVAGVVGFLLTMGKIIALIAIMLAVGILGLVAFAVTGPMKFLEEFASAASTAIPALAKGIENLPALFAAVDASNNLFGKDENEGGIIGFLKDVGNAVLGPLAQLAKWAQLGAIMAALGLIGGASIAELPGIKALGDAGGALGVGIPGLVTGLRNLPALMSVLSATNINRRDFDKLNMIMNELGEVGAGFRSNMAKIEAIRTTSDMFKLAIEENILQPVMKLDPAIAKINSLKDATRDLNIELKKMAVENKGALSTVMGNGDSQSVLGRVGPGANNNAAASSNSFTDNNDDNKYRDSMLEYIAGDVHGIAQKTITNQHSWMDNSAPTK